MMERRVRLLVPLDGTPAAEAVLPTLLPLFRHSHVRMTLLGVAPTDDALPALELALNRLKMSLLLDRVPAEVEVVRGDPAVEILRVARDGGYGLIAMVTHGRSGLHRKLVGSVAEEVLRASPIPVLCFRPGAKVGDWNRIVVGLDGSAAAEAVLADAAELARALGSTLHLVGVKSPFPRLIMRPDLAFPIPEEDPQAYLDRVADDLARRGVMAVAETRMGDAAEELLSAAKALNAGLVCMATHGRSGLARKLLGSVAESVLHAAPCPVLLRRTIPVPAMQ